MTQTAVQLRLYTAPPGWFQRSSGPSMQVRNEIAARQADAGGEASKLQLEDAVAASSKADIRVSARSLWVQGAAGDTCQELMRRNKEALVWKSVTGFLMTRLPKHPASLQGMQLQRAHSLVLL